MNNLLRETAILCLTEDPAYVGGHLAADLLAAGAQVDLLPATTSLDFGRGSYRLVLIDAPASGDQYFALCARLRSATRLPIMLILRGTARDDTLRGYAAGADACIRVPYDPRELEARAAALIRRELSRPGASQPPRQRVGSAPAG